MHKNKKILITLLCACIFMFAFSFALVPLYNVLCKTLGINGKTNATRIDNKNAIDYSRSVTIEFLATTNNKLPWNFYPETKTIKIHPGQNTKIFYDAQNNSSDVITAQAVPSITPSIAAKYFKKIECFCFRKQTLQPHEKIRMPVIFYLNPSCPKNIHEITLSYSLFQVR